MLIETTQLVECAMAEIALIGPSIVRCRSCLVLGGALPTDQLLGDDPVRVLGSDEFVDLVPVEASSRTASGLHVVCEASSRGKFGLAKGAGNVLA